MRNSFSTIVMAMLVVVIILQMYALYQQQEKYTPAQSQQILSRVKNLKNTGSHFVTSVWRQLVASYQASLVDLKQIGKVGIEMLQQSGYKVKNVNSPLTKTNIRHFLVLKGEKPLTFRDLYEQTKQYTEKRTPSPVDREIIRIIHSSIASMTLPPRSPAIPARPQQPFAMTIASHKAIPSGFSGHHANFLQDVQNALIATGCHEQFKTLLSHPDNASRLFQDLSNASVYSEEDLGALMLIMYGNGVWIQ